MLSINDNKPKTPKMITSLIIPMAKQDKAFAKDGANLNKAFLPVHGAPMIAHIFSNFPLPEEGGPRRIIITCKEYIEHVHYQYLTEQLGCFIVFIPPHENGNAATLLNAKSQLLALDPNIEKQPTFISPSDIGWIWDWESIQKSTSNIENKTTIFTHNGFHPHYVGTDFEHAQNIGVYYVQQLGDILSEINISPTDREPSISGIFSESVKKDLAKDSDKINSHPVEVFVEWKTPEQLEDFEKWAQIEVEADRSMMTDIRAARIISMADKNSLPKENQKYPIPLYPVRGQPLYDYIADKFPAGRTTLLTSPEISQILGPATGLHEIYSLAEATDSEFETLKKAQHVLSEETAFFMLSYNSYGLFNAEDFENFLEWRKPDIVVFSYNPSPLHHKRDLKKSHITCHDDRVTELHIGSRRYDTDRGLAGFCWFAHGGYFDALDLTPLDNTKNMTIDHFLKYMVDNNYRVMHYELDAYIHLGSAEEIKEFEFWTRRPSLFRSMEAL